MSDRPRPIATDDLSERAKELACLYQIDEIFADRSLAVEAALQSVAERIPAAFRQPDRCRAHISLYGKTYGPPVSTEVATSLSAPIVTAEGRSGTLEVTYLVQDSRTALPFLAEEERLVQAISRRIADAIGWRKFSRRGCDEDGGPESRWRTIVDLLLRTDQRLYSRFARKLMYHMYWSEVPGAREFFAEDGVAVRQEISGEGENFPLTHVAQPDELRMSERVFAFAEEKLAERTVLALLQRWLQEDKASLTFRTLINLDHSLEDVTEAVRRFISLNPPYGPSVSENTDRALRVLLTRRLITNQLPYISAAKKHVTVRDFFDLTGQLIIPKKSHGVIGGKAAGLFLASRILRAYAAERPTLSRVTAPKTWYLPSDSLHYFMHYNDMEEMFEQKYKPVEEVRKEYPRVIQLFKGSRFPPDVVQGLSMALDDLGEDPIIVRSSSRLEDGFGSAFSGKYKSLFLANQGPKKERLSALLDAVSEVYSSLFGPDPVQYRAERGLLDVREEMGVIIQRVVGTRVGPYYLPACAGIAFSNNEFRWSPRIRREDGLIRLVPGLGTRAVDRIGDDYPVLVAPGNRDIRVNNNPDEIARYSPARMDVIDLSSNSFTTIRIREFLAEYGDSFPGLERLVSVYAEGAMRRKARLTLDPANDNLVVTFDGLIHDTEFVATINDMLEVLATELATPVDIEFAYDGEQIWLLQCRPQSRSAETAPSPIPQNVSQDDVVFSANRYVSNGLVPEITHIVYVDARKYGALESPRKMQQVTEIIGHLNTILPKRSFILMGPGRWGSRGDIRLGVGTTYADISNTAVLIEVAEKTGDYLPDVSFGTHFFQDLVEASIRYLPLFPDDPEVVFNQRFLRRADNELKDLLPEYRELADVVRVIDVPKAADGRILRVLFNAELDQALAILDTPSRDARKPSELRLDDRRETPDADVHWRWRLDMANRIADAIDTTRFGVKALYIIGSVNNATAGPASDIDLIVHHTGQEDRLRELNTWFEAWSTCLDEVNYLRTGYRTGGLLDVHILTDEDIARRTSYAIKINAVTDPAQELSLRR